MAASASRIAFIQQQFRRAVSETASVKTRYGSLARETDDPVETFFDSATDAQTVATARQALLSVARRRFKLDVKGVSEVLAVSYVGEVPRGAYVDTERDVNKTMLVSEIFVDLARQVSHLTVWG